MLDKEGRYVVLQGFLLGIEMIIVAVYAPNKKRTQFWNNICSIVKDINGKQVLVLGDFNAVMNLDTDRSKHTTTPRMPLIIDNV